MLAYLLKNTKNFAFHQAMFTSEEALESWSPHKTNGGYLMACLFCSLDFRSVQPKAPIFGPFLLHMGWISPFLKKHQISLTLRKNKTVHLLMKMMKMSWGSPQSQKVKTKEQ